jgi:hypothetical protein
LTEAAVARAGATLLFPLAARVLPAPFLPVTFSVGYWTGGAMVFGHVTVTAP